MENACKSPEVETQIKLDYQPVQDSVLKKIKGAWITSLILSLVIASLASLSTFFNISVSGASWENYIDVIFILGFTYGIYKKSRTAALLMFLYYVLSRIVIYMELGKPSGLLIAVVVTIFLFRGVIGTFQYHKHFKLQDKLYKAGKSWLPWVLTPVVVLFLVLLVVGVMSSTGALVPTKVLSGDEVPQKYRELLIQNEVIYPEEKITLFYSEGFADIMEGGNLITDVRVISYETLNGELNIYGDEFNQLSHAEMDSKGDYLNDSLIYIEKKNGDYFYMLSSVEESGDVKMLNVLQGKIKNSVTVGDISESTSNKKSRN